LPRCYTTTTCNAKDCDYNYKTSSRESFKRKRDESDETEKNWMRNLPTTLRSLQQRLRLQNAIKREFTTEKKEDSSEETE